MFDPADVDLCTWCGKEIGRSEFSFDRAIERIRSDKSIDVESAERIAGFCAESCLNAGRPLLIEGFDHLKSSADRSMVPCAVCGTFIHRTVRHFAINETGGVYVDTVSFQPNYVRFVAAICESLSCREIEKKGEVQLRERVNGHWATRQRAGGDVP